MRHTSFGSAPSRGPGGLALVGALFIIAGVSWWLWSRGDDGQGVDPAALSARSGAGKTQPKSADPTDAKQPQEQPKKADPAITKQTQEPKEDDLSKARRRADALRKAGDDDAFRRHLGVFALDRRLPRAERAALLTECDKLNDRLVWSATPGPSFLSVKVEPGDSYWKIARRLWKAKKTTATAGLIEAINQVRPNRLRLGQKLKVPTEDVSLLVDKSDFTLYVLLGGAYIRQYPIGIGKGGSTPEGEFQIKGKTRKPYWRDPKTGKRFKYGEEGHVIGSRWMGFITTDGASTGYGIHGTVEPDTIGKSASEGCIRLLDTHVEELFELVQEGAGVTVRS